jgi:HECT-domain (ubiquitin-transferase)
VYPAPTALHQPRGADTLRLLGLTVGKALYEGLLLDAELAPPFVLALQRRPPALEDLAALDADLYRSLLQANACRPVVLPCLCGGLGTHAMVLCTTRCW